MNRPHRMPPPMRHEQKGWRLTPAGGCLLALIVGLLLWTAVGWLAFHAGYNAGSRQMTVIVHAG